MGHFHFYLNDSIVLLSCVMKVVIKSLKLTMLIKSVIIIYIVDLQ